MEENTGKSRARRKKERKKVMKTEKKSVWRDRKIGKNYIKKRGFLLQFIGHHAKIWVHRMGIPYSYICCLEII